MNMESCAKRKDLEDFNKRMADLAPMKMIKDMQEDVGDFIKREEFNI